MTDGALDLASWLLEQIAKDERSVRRNWNGATGMTDERWWQTPFQPSRVLAECEAKRQRLAYLRENVMFWDGFRDVPTAAGMTMLRIEALPYVDRPGYREEWALQ